MDTHPQVVFRVEKLKTLGEITGALAHQFRQRTTLNANRDRENVVIVAPPAGDQILNTICKDLTRGIPSKNAVLASDVLISASPEYFRAGSSGEAGAWDSNKLADWRAAIEPWIATRFPHALAVVLHLDEATPHYAIIDVPVNLRTGRLSHRAKFGGNTRRGEGNQLTKWQTWAAEPVAHLGIERGTAGSLATHTDIKRYYKNVMGPMPAIPEISISEQKPLPVATLPQKIPGSKAKAARDRQEALHKRREADRKRQIEARMSAMDKAWQLMADRANHGQLALEQNRPLQNSVRSLQAKLVELQKDTKRFAAPTIVNVLQKIYRAADVQKGNESNQKTRKFSLPFGFEVELDGDDRWTIQRIEKGQGALSLIMHLDGLDQRQAVKLLSEYFDTAQTLAAVMAHRRLEIENEVKKIASSEKLAAPAANSENWRTVKLWLERTKGIPAILIDKLHRGDLLHADQRGNCVFRRDNGGAYVVGISQDTTFLRVIGGHTCGGFVIEGAKGANVFLVDSPIEALAIAAIESRVKVVCTDGTVEGLNDVLQRLPGIATVVDALTSANRKHTILLKKAFPSITRHKLPSQAGSWSQLLIKEPWRVAKEWKHITSDAELPEDHDEPDSQRLG